MAARSRTVPTIMPWKGKASTPIANPSAVAAAPITGPARCRSCMAAAAATRAHTICRLWWSIRPGANWMNNCVVATITTAAA